MELTIRATAVMTASRRLSMAMTLPQTGTARTIMAMEMTQIRQMVALQML